MTAATGGASNGVYFRGFNALRFYAALSVVVQHVSYSPHDWFGVALLPVTLERLFLTGQDAVNLFFILSGFLITYLLLNEREKTGTVSIRNFYIRRAFRIYPVYFLYLFGVFLLLRPQYPPELVLLLTFFMGNAAFVLFFPFPPFEHLWSIGVEEQYYLLAPILVRVRAHAAKIAVGIIVVWWVLLILTMLIPPSTLTAFIQMSRYDLIALGALTAYASYHQWSILRLVERHEVLVTALVVIAYAIVFGMPTTAVLYSTIVSIAFTVLIYHVTAGHGIARLLDKRLPEYLGRLSYSMYVYHPLFVLLFYTLFYQRLDLTTYQVIAYPTIIGVTLLASWLSYEKFERLFLNLKDRFRRDFSAKYDANSGESDTPDMIVSK